MNNKKLAFTLAEVVVVMAILGVMMAAFAPVVTKRTVAAGSNMFRSFTTTSGHTGIFYGTTSDTKNVLIGDTSTPAYFNSSSIKPKLSIVNPYSTATSTFHPLIAYGTKYSTTDAPVYFGQLTATRNGALILGGYTANPTTTSTSSTAPVPRVYTTSNGAGNQNTIIGMQAGQYITTGTNNTIIGYNAGPTSSSTVSNRIYIGNNATTYGSDTVYFGNAPLSTVAGRTVSDIRLKNVGKEFTGGIDELNKLTFYNFTYKRDADKNPKVGVMAQDLQKVFPDAVSKNDEGYLYIRKDDMFYAALNAIKDLFAKITDNSEKIKALEERNAILEQQNKELQNLYIELSQRVDKLDKKKTKGKLTIIPEKEVEEIPETEIQTEETTGE